LCAVVDRAEPPHRVRLYRIRRRNLPETEDSGNFQDLQLAERAGLAEAIHIVLFGDSVIGSEYNHYGPRVTTFGYFMNERCGQDDVRIRQFVRRDVLNSILAMREIRRFRVKVTPHGTAELQRRGVALSEGLDAADIFRAGKYVDLTWVSEPQDDEFTQRIKRFFRQLRDSNEDPTTFIEAAQVYGVTPDDALDELDLLRDRVVIVQQIRRENPRHRTLDTEAAYGAIEAAHADLADELAEGGTLKVEDR
jgi:hypothetical protein